MTGRLSKNFHGVDIGPLSKILAVNDVQIKVEFTAGYKYPFITFQSYATVVKQ